MSRLDPERWAEVERLFERAGALPRRTSILPGSRDLFWGGWSPDAGLIAPTDGRRIRIFNIRTRQWTLLDGSALAANGSANAP